MSAIEDNCDYRIDLSVVATKSYNEYELNVKYLHEHIVSLLEDGFKIQKHNYNANTALDHDHELKIITEKNKQLRQQIDSKLEELSQQQNKYENYKKDQKLLSQEIKETHEAFLMAKKYYKKFLKMYYTIENKSGDKQTIFIQFFSDAKKDSENYSVRLLRDTKTGHYQLLSAVPKLPVLKELQRKIQETNDVPGALCCIRQIFLAVKINKKQ